MIAVIEINNKQYTIEENQIFDVEKLTETEKKTFKIDKILLIHNKDKTEIGQPYLNGASAELEILETYKDKKVIIFKFKRKTGYKLTKGHRQELTTVKVKKITAGKTNAEKTSSKEKTEPKETKKKEEKASKTVKANTKE